MQNLIYAVLGVILTVIGTYQVMPSMSAYIQSKKAENLISKEDEIFDAVKKYYSTVGYAPADITALVTAGFLDSGTATDNGFGNPFTLSTNSTTGVVSVSTTIADANARATYVQNWRHSIKPTVNATTGAITSQFILPTEILGSSIGGSLAQATISSSAPDFTKYKYWYDTSSGGEAILKLSDGTKWVIASAPTTSELPPVTSTTTVASATSLPTTGVSTGDIRYVYNDISKTIDTYTYYSGSWSMLGSGGTTVSVANRCRQNWIFIPNSEGQYDSPKGWCVMKYEASVFTGSFAADSYGGFKWENADDTNLTKKVGSFVNKPFHSVSNVNARSMCSSSHLVDFNGNAITGGFPMRYNLWTLLAKDIANNPVNWSTGVVGSGYIYSGHNDNSPKNALVPAADTDPYNGTGQTSGNQKRVLYTSNGEAIWDLAGNSWETMFERQNVGSSDTTPKEYTEATTNAFSPQSLMGKNWSSANGVGMSRYGLGTTASNIPPVFGTYLLMQGGSWRTEAGGVGLFTSWWGNGAYDTFKNEEVGVRCVAPAR